MPRSVRVVGRRRKGQIQAQFERLLNHVGDYPVQQRTSTLQARICIDFDQPRLEMPINHEVQSEYFEVVLSISGRDFQAHAFSCVSGHLLHSRQNLSLEIVLFVLVGRIQIPLKFFIRKLVEWLIPMILWESFLNSVIREMNLWLKVVDVEFVAGSANISFAVPVSPQDAVEVGDQHVVANIEFAVVVEEGPI